MPRDSEGSCSEVMRAWFAVSILLPCSPPLETSCTRHPRRNDRYSPGCLTRNLPLETHYRGFQSFWRREFGEVVVWLKMPKRFAEGVFREERKVRFLVRQCERETYSGSQIG